MGTLPKKIRIRELGPREGFQTLAAVVPTAKKLALIAALNRTGVGDIEIASFVRPDRVPQMADAESVVASYERLEGVRYTGLYLNVAGFERAEAAKRLDNQGWLNIAASATFLKRNSNCTLAEAIDAVPKWLHAFESAGKQLHGLMLSTAFGCNYEGTIAADKALHVLKSVVSKIEENGAALREVCLADTVGRGNPNSIRALVGMVRNAYPELYISLHLHDTRGTGMANVYAGLQEGIDCFDASVAGVGGCPFAKGAAGNVPSEDVAYLCQELGIDSGVNLEAYARAAMLAEEITGMVLPGKYYKAFRAGVQPS